MLRIKLNGGMKQEKIAEWEGRTKKLLSSIILTLLGLAYISRIFV